MKNETPILLFAFANHAENPLDNLAEEERAARDALAMAHDQGRIEFLSVGSTTLNDIYRAFNRFHNRIALFHYGGHSDEEFLELEDTRSRAGSLSKIIGMQRKLQLVFLNGCGNRNQVKELFDKGVKAVIATDTAINDQRARIFSQQFYAALAAGKCIQDAFDTAVAFVQNDHPELEIVNRGIRFRDEEATHIPWGLYTQDDKILEWTLPPPREQPADLDYSQKVPIGHLELNRQLVLLTFQGLVKYSPEDEIFYQLYEKTPTTKWFNVLQNTMLDAFPSIISVQVQDLFTVEVCRQGRLRLTEIREAYETIIRFLCSIAMANLWDVALEMREQRPKTGLIIRKEYLQEIQSFLDMSPEASHSYDYVWMVDTISRIMTDNGVEPYVKELAYFNQASQESSQGDDGYAEYHEACTFLEKDLRQRLIAGNIASREVEDLCLEAEYHLARLMQQCAFLCCYQLVTVKDVSVYQPRPDPEPVFIHSNTLLKGRNYHTDTKSPVRRQSYLSNNAVVLTRNIEQDVAPLNLSPFVVDENVFVKKVALPKIYFFSGQSGQQDTLCYQHAEMKQDDFCIERTYNTRKYHDLEVLFQQLDFFRTILGLETK